jgi:Arc/MetJ-type ribon-helix-helix transcriptional regulator
VGEWITRIDDELAAAVDDLVAAGVVANQSEAVRLGLRRLVESHRRDDNGRRIVAGYRAQPQQEADLEWADEAAARMIAEPW